MGGVDKIFAPLCGRPVISYSLEALQGAPQVDDIVLVLARHNVDRGRRLVEAEGWQKVREVCVGGERRQQSVRHGLDRLHEAEWVIVHDGARPFIDGELISEGLAAAAHSGAAVAAVPVKDTIKSADAELFVAETSVATRCGPPRPHRCSGGSSWLTRTAVSPKT